MSPTPQTVTPKIQITQAAAVLVDLDGCLLAGSSPAPGAEQLLQLAGERLVVVSNNSTDTAASMAAKLREMDLGIPPERIILAGEVAVQQVRERYPMTPVLALAAGPLAASLGDLPRGEDKAGVVLLCRDLDLSYPRLAMAARALRRGAVLMAANPDLTHPDAQGNPVPETGSLLAALRAMVPEAPVTLVGKPESALYLAALKRLGADPGEALMIGDNPDTDIAGAQRLGMPGLLVGPRADGVAHLAALLMD